MGLKASAPGQRAPGPCPAKASLQKCAGVERGCDRHHASGLVGKTARGIGGSDGSSRRHHLETALAPGAKLADIHVSCAPFARAVRDILRAPIRVELCGRTLGHGQRKMSTQLRRMRSDHAQRLARHQLQPGPCEPAAVCRTGRSAHARCFHSRAAHTYRTRPCRRNPAVSASARASRNLQNPATWPRP